LQRRVGQRSWRRAYFVRISVFASAISSSAIDSGISSPNASMKNCPCASQKMTRATRLVAALPFFARWSSIAAQPSLGSSTLLVVYRYSAQLRCTSAQLLLTRKHTVYHCARGGRKCRGFADDFALRLPCGVIAVAMALRDNARRAASEGVAT